MADRARWIKIVNLEPGKKSVFWMMHLLPFSPKRVILKIESFKQIWVQGIREKEVVR